MIDNIRKSARWSGTIAILLGCIAITTISRTSSLESTGYKLCGFDGVFYLSGIKVLRNLLFPLIILYINLYGKRCNFESYNVVRQKGRIYIWNRVIASVFVQCVCIIAISMVAAGGILWIRTGVWNNFRDINSMFYSESRQIYSNGLLDSNVPMMVIISLVLNSGELYIHVLTGMLVYWIWDSPILSIIVVILANMLPERTDFFILGDEVFCYREICIWINAIQSIMFIIIGVTIIQIIAGLYVPRKNFYKN